MIHNNPNCDGGGPHDSGEVRRYPLGGSANLILCLRCWARENQYRYRRGLDAGQCQCPACVPIGTYEHEDTCPWAAWPQQDWAAAEVYTT